MPREKRANCLFRDYMHTGNIIETTLDIFFTSLKILKSYLTKYLFDIFWIILYSHYKAHWYYVKSKTTFWPLHFILYLTLGFALSERSEFPIKDTRIQWIIAESSISFLCPEIIFNVFSFLLRQIQYIGICFSQITLSLLS